MFNRTDKMFVVTTNNLRALEAITEWIYRMLQTSYFIQIEMFPNMTLYRICIPMRKDWDEKVTRGITKDLTARHIEIMESLT